MIYVEDTMTSLLRFPKLPTTGVTPGSSTDPNTKKTHWFAIDEDGKTVVEYASSYEELAKLVKNLGYSLPYDDSK